MRRLIQSLATLFNKIEKDKKNSNTMDRNENKVSLQRKKHTQDTRRSKGNTSDEHSM